jgi:2-oxoglutarate ferredoxin oxidoreductase subunit beta
MRPESYGNVVDQPFHPNNLKTGVLVRNDRPEYGETYRNRLKQIESSK